MIIAIDGPAASGKGTIAGQLAEHLGYAMLDTGALYRAVALAVRRARGDPSDPEAATKAAANLDLALTQDPEIRSAESGAAASIVAAVPAVRAALLNTQRQFAAHPPGGAPGAILDGRDIASTICPDADRKLFITAELATRAGRRCKQLRERGEGVIYARILAELAERDARDAGRKVAPMEVAMGALVLDTTHLDPDQAFAQALAFVESGVEFGAEFGAEFGV